MVNNEIHIKRVATNLLTDKEGQNPLSKNANCLVQEMNWFASLVNNRLSQHFHKDISHSESTQNGKPQEAETENFIEPGPPDLENDNSIYAEFVKYYRLTSSERILLMLVLTPHIQPHLLDVFFSLNPKTGRGYTEFGGVKGEHHGGFIPTIETALFIIAGNDLTQRFQAGHLFEPEHIFLAHGIITLSGSNNSYEPYFSNVINLSDEYVDFFTTGKLRKPQFSTTFPAKLLTTGMNWDDLVVDEHTALQLNEIRIWLQHGKTLLEDWGMASKIKPGYKVLFHGPPGTGKTLTAALLGKLFNLDVYRIDLSMVVSKYIGETEKNLEKIFSKAENKNWILFFDEADALFGKRTDIRDAHDKYANQEISYLLQRLEDYPGLVILASNMRNNVDEAFTRRLQGVILFKKPQAKERLILWKNSFSKHCQIPDEKVLERISQQFDITGGGIMNAVQYASLMALSRNEKEISHDDIIAGIKKEFNKEGKTI